MTHLLVVNKLIGPIEPVGETTTDEKRYENLKAQCELVEQLILDIQYVAKNNKDRHEHSMKRAGEYADRFLTNTIGITAESTGREAGSDGGTIYS
jgi:hypothetical protein